MDMSKIKNLANLFIGIIVFLNFQMFINWTLDLKIINYSWIYFDRKSKSPLPQFLIRSPAPPPTSPSTTLRSRSTSSRRWWTRRASPPRFPVASTPSSRAAAATAAWDPRGSSSCAPRARACCRCCGGNRIPRDPGERPTRRRTVREINSIRLILCSADHSYLRVYCMRFSECVPQERLTKLYNLCRFGSVHILSFYISLFLQFVCIVSAILCGF